MSKIRATAWNGDQWDAPDQDPLYNLQNKLNLVHRFLINERTDSCLIQVDLALGGHQLGHVADQPHAQPRRSEVPPDQVGGRTPPSSPAGSARTVGAG